MTDVQKVFFEGVLLEHEYAENKHKSWPDDDAVHASAIINEEAGKLTQASIDYTYGVPGDPHDMRKYCLRVAAMALRYYASLPTYAPLKK